MTHSCRSGHMHVDPVAVLLCQQDEAIQLLERILLMTETTGETIDQVLTNEEADATTIEGKLDALTAEEERELAFLADLENNRGASQLAPDQQARADDLRARAAKVAAALDAAREELAQADGSEPAPSEPPVSEAPVASGTDAPVGEPVSDTPIADSIGEPSETRVITSANLVSTDEAGNPVLTNVQTGDGMATGAAPVTDDVEPGSNED